MPKGDNRRKKATVYLRLCDNFPFGFLETFSYIKKQLKAYCRKERLDFKEDGGVRAMTRLTEYIDSLIHGDRKSVV